MPRHDPTTANAANATPAPASAGETMPATSGIEALTDQPSRHAVAAQATMTTRHSDMRATSLAHDDSAAH